jgi:hypothetical protein
MAEVKLYRTYSYIDKNPVIDRVRTLLNDEGLFKRLGIVHEISGVSASTLRNWFHGDTRNPQHGTIAAVITSMGYREEFVKDKEIDIEKEREIARAWLAKRKKRGNAKPVGKKK